MSTLISNPFYVQWHDEGHDGGQWNGSSTGRDFHELDEWALPAEPGESTFYFSAKQDKTYAGTLVFALMDDLGGPEDVHYGAKIDASSGLTATALRFIPQGTELVFTAGRVIADDPKIKISQTTTRPTCALIWTGKRWLYSYDPDAPQSAYRTYDCTDPNAVLELGPGGKHTITVTDQTADGSDHRCAVYYADADAATGTEVGLVQSQTPLRDPRSPASIQLDSPTDRDWQCTLNLFLGLSNYRSSVLRQA